VAAKARSIRVITFPHDDVAFRAHVSAAQASLGRWDAPAINEEIRKAYPSAVVQESNVMAQFESGQQTFYAYRDGALKPTPDEGEWWHDESLPRTAVTASGAYVEANDAAAELFGVSHDEILAARSGEFTRNEGTDELRERLFAALTETGSLNSTAVVVRPDGEEWPVQFHTERRADEDRYVTVMRRVEAPTPHARD
jgi:PAS domain S-box-containing protein